MCLNRSYCVSPPLVAVVPRASIHVEEERGMSEESEQVLKREVGWYGSFSMGYADVGADIYVAIGLVAFYAAGASPLAFAIASTTYICTGLAYAELATAYPYAGGAHVYAMKAFNDLVGFIAGWAVMLDYTVDIALFSIATAGYVSFFVPWLKNAGFPIALFGWQLTFRYIGLLAFILVGILLFLNLIGIRESSLFNEILVSMDLFVEAVILIFGFVLAFSVGRFLSQVATLGADTAFQSIAYVLPRTEIQSQNFIYGVTLAMTSFIGIESIAQAAEETKRPHKWIPRANKLSIVSVIVFAIGLSVVSMGMMPWQSLAAAQSDPMAAIAASIPVVGRYLAPVVAITGFAICYVSTNTGVIGVSRIVFSMGRFKLMPKWFYKVHSKFRTPYRTILVFGLIGAILASLGELHFVADLYNFGALLSYIVVNICLIVLRNSEPEAYRSWKIPGDLKVRVGSRSLIIPIISVLGFVSCTILWLLVIAYHPAGRILGALWILIGVSGFIIYRRMLKLPATSSETGKSIRPGGYVMNALVLVRTPEDEDAVVSSLKEALDPRFRITLMSILDPRDQGLSLEEVRQYEEIKMSERESIKELEQIARKLRSRGYDSRVRVEVGPTEKILKLEAESDVNDMIVLIKRKTLKSDIEKERMDSVHAIVSRYPGKLMVIRRLESNA